MFTYVNKQGVKSDKGFVVQRTGRFTAEYQEGEKKISIELENDLLDNDKICEIIDANAFLKWDDGAFIPTEKQLEILQNFKNAMNFQDIEIIVK